MGNHQSNSCDCCCSVSSLKVYYWMSTFSMSILSVLLELFSCIEIVRFEEMKDKVD